MSRSTSTTSEPRVGGIVGALALGFGAPAAVRVHRNTVPAGGILTFSATGFRPGAELAVTFDYTTPLTTFPLDMSGATDEFARLVIPDAAGDGAHVISFTDHTTMFDLLVHTTLHNAAVAIARGTVAAGGSVRFVGHGFPADSEVHVKFDDSGAPQAFEADPAGAISGAVVIPDDAEPGSHELWFLAPPATSTAVPVHVR